MKPPFNTRVLVIDDEESIRDSFREILLPRQRDYSALEEAGRSLFGDEATRGAEPQTFSFDLDEADSGEGGVELVRQAVEAGHPYASIFVDMRMPGWDGLETVRHIREHDKRAEIIFITAYGDYSIEEVVSQAGANVGYHTKPFAPEEIRQLATKTVYEWNKTRGLEDLIHVISDLRATDAELDLLLHNILNQVSELVGSRSALLAVREGSRYKKMIGTGILADDEVALQHLADLPVVDQDEVYQSSDYIYFPMDRYGVFALFERDSGPLRNDRIYMVQLFLEQATQAIRNAELHEALLRSERLSAMGKGVSVVAHDLRNPLGNILSLVELVEADYSLQAELREHLELIRQSARNATSIVEDILDFTRDSQVEGRRVRADHILREVKRVAGESVQHAPLQLEIRDQAADFTLTADESKMQRVLVNLVRNAAEAITRRGCGTGSSGGDSGRITVSAHRQDHAAVFLVEDNGPGIPGEIRDQLFVPFATGGKQGGTGLGLPIVKQFVDAHGGEIELDSSDRGTSFRITLPDRA